MELSAKACHLPRRLNAALRFCAIVGLIACSLAPSALAQSRRPKTPKTSPSQSVPDEKTNSESARRFVGIWTAEFQDTTFLRLEIRMADGKFTGNIATGNIHTAEDGRLTDVSVPDPNHATAIFDIAMDGNTLTFKRRDGDDIDRMQLTLTTRGTAELRFTGTDSEPAPRVQPIQLTRIIER
jgi:hypothetical protein